MREKQIIEEIKANNIEFVKDIPIDYVFSDGTSILHNAALYNNQDLTLYLLSRDIDVNLRGGKYKSTILMFTVYNYSLDCSFILLEFGADINILNDRGYRCVHLCLKFNNILLFILIFCYSENVNLYDKEERCICYMAYKNKKYRFIQVIERLKNDGVIKCCNNTPYKFRKGISDHLKVLINTKGFEMLFITLLVVLFIKLPTICFIILVYLTFSTKRALNTNHIYPALNILYTGYYLYKTLLVNKASIILICPYIIVLCRLLNHQSIKKAVGFKEGKLYIKRLIKAGKYTMNEFCYICWIEKDDKTYHCHICKSCISNHDHHCRFLGICIDSKTIVLFNMYLIMTVVLFLFFKDIKMSTLHRLHYKVFLILIIIQLFQRI